MTKFNDLPLSPSILQALTDLGFDTPSPIQAETLPLLLGQREDFLGLAATGTGKTAAFGIPLLERIDPKKRGVQGLILCPTRELAIQVAGQIDLLGKYLKIRALPIYGGVGYRDQFEGLERGATIVVGTPGRVVDHIEKGSLRLDNLQTLVLDEADEMISMGFKEDLETVLKKVPAGQANTWLFSATMSSEVRHVADAYLKNPKKVQVNRAEMLPSTVEQVFYMVHEYDKPEVLCKLIDVADDFYGLVFCQTKSLVIDLHQYLVSRGYKADALHGDLNQEQRDRSMRAFRDHKVQVLVATDVACRGLDVKDVTHVVNYSLPRELDNYVHRIGRTARSGKSGVAVSLVTKSHRMLVSRIEQMTKSRMTEGQVPSRKEIGQRKVSRMLAAFDAAPHSERAMGLLDDSWKAALATKSPEEIAGRFLTLMYPDIFMDREKSAAPARLDDSRPAAPEENRRSDRRRRDSDDRGPRPVRARENFSAPSAPRLPTPRVVVSPSEAVNENSLDRMLAPDDGESAISAPTPRAEAPRKTFAPKPRSAFGARDRFSGKEGEQRSEGAPRREFSDRGPSRSGGAGKRFESRDRSDRKPPWDRKSAPKPWGKPHAGPGDRYKRDRSAAPGEFTKPRSTASWAEKNETGSWKTRGPKTETASIRPAAKHGRDRPFSAKVEEKKPFAKEGRKLPKWGRTSKET